jgi:hypothetical protein
MTMPATTEQPADNLRNIHQRLHAVMQAVDYIQKERKAGMNYTIVSHDAVTAKVRPALVEHGVIYYPVKIDRRQEGNRTEMDVTVRFVNVDQPTDFIDVACCGYGIDSQDKGPGKATSYAVKYALLKALGLETGDEPDEQSIPHNPNSKPAPHPASVKSITLDMGEGEVETFPATKRGAIDFLNRLEEMVSKNRWYWTANEETARKLAEQECFAEQVQRIANTNLRMAG